MARALPPLNWFRAFECAARHLNFTAAANELGLTQSAVSQQVRSLELRFGVSLFQRKPRGLALTDDGRRLLPEVSAALGKLSSVTSAFDTGSTQGLLTVATSVSFAQWYLAPALPRFLKAHPGARVRIASTIWPDNFHASIADVEIRFGSEALVGKGAERLLPDSLIAVAAPGLPVEPEALDAHPLIEAVGTSDGWKQFAELAGYPQALNATLYVDYYGLALDLARAGAGVALVSSLLAAPGLADGSLVQVHEQRTPSREGYFLSTVDNAPTVVSDFRSWLLQEISASMARPVP